MLYPPAGQVIKSRYEKVAVFVGTNNLSAIKYQLNP